MKTEIACSVNGCNYIARHNKPIVAKRMIGVHKTRVHGIRSESALRNDKYRRKKMGRRRISSQPMETGNDNSEQLIRLLLEELQFCPKCGKNLTKHLTAIVALSK